MITPLNHVFYLLQSNLKHISSLIVLQEVIKRLVVETHISEYDFAWIGHKRVDFVHDGFELHLFFAQILELMHVEVEVAFKPRFENQLLHDVFVLVFECRSSVQLHEKIERVVYVREDQLEVVFAALIFALLQYVRRYFVVYLYSVYSVIRDGY